MHSQLTPSVHGHEVMDAIVTSGRQFNRDSLAAFIVDQFGPATRFHTCSASEMTAEDLIDFLASRGKFTGTEEAFTIDVRHRCQH